MKCTVLGGAGQYPAAGVWGLMRSLSECDHISRNALRHIPIMRIYQDMVLGTSIPR